MKIAKKLLCAMLALLVVVSLVPVQASAASDTAKVQIVYVCNKKEIKKETIKVGDEAVTLEPEQYLHIKDKTYNLKGFANGKTTYTIPAYKDTDAWHKKYDKITITYEPHTHKYFFTYDRMQHMHHCACGKDFEPEPHIDPTTAPDKTCTCGYKFSDNTDLVTLWFEGVRFDEKLEKGVTEYHGTTIAWADVTQTRITAAPFDAKAVVEIPTDTAIQEGPNTFQIKVTAEDKTTTALYTFNIVKPIKVDGVQVGYDGMTLTAEPKTLTKSKVATAQMSEALVNKIAELAVQDTCQQIVLKPAFSKWSNNQVDIPLSAATVKQIAESHEIGLAVKTEFGNVTIPHAALVKLAEAGESITVSIVKGAGVKLFTDGNEVTELPEGVVFEG